jgi:hypothetical protein
MVVSFELLKVRVHRLIAELLQSIAAGAKLI